MSQAQSQELPTQHLIDTIRAIKRDLDGLEQLQTFQRTLLRGLQSECDELLRTHADSKPQS